MNHHIEQYWSWQRILKKNELSKELELWADDMIKAVKIESGFFADVCNSAIKEINFYEIAESYIEEK